jgi:hypothetical protein
MKKYFLAGEITMNLYEVEICAYNDSVNYYNIYRVVANGVIEATNKVISRIKGIDKLDNVDIKRVQLLETGLIV